MFQVGWRGIAIVAGFAAATWAADVGMAGLTLVEPHVNARRAEALFAYATRDDTEDVLIIGSSRVAGGFDARSLSDEMARVTGEDVGIYKLGLAALRPLFLADVLEQVVARRPPAELLVIAVEYRFFATPVADRPERAGRVVQAAGRGDDDEPAASAIHGEWEADEVVSGLWSAFDGLRTLWMADWMLSDDVRANRAFRNANCGEEWSVEDRRVVEHQRTAAGAPGLDAAGAQSWLWGAPDGPDQVGWERTLALCEQLPCQVVFIRMPLVERFEQERMAALADEFERRVVPGILERGFKYADLNRPPYPRGAEDFVGFTHLSIAGCEKTSRLFVRDLLGPWWARQER